MNSNNLLFISNIPNSAKLDTLRAALMQYTTSTFTICRLSLKGKKQSSYRVRLQMDCFSDLERLLAAEIFIGSHLLSISKYILKSERLRKDAQIFGRKLYLGNLPPLKSQTELELVLETLGPLEEFFVKPDRKGNLLYAFVTFCCLEDAKKLLHQKDRFLPSDWSEITLNLYNPKTVVAKVKSEKNRHNKSKRGHLRRRTGRAEKKRRETSLEQSFVLHQSSQQMETPQLRTRDYKGKFGRKSAHVQQWKDTFHPRQQPVFSQTSLAQPLGGFSPWVSQEIGTLAVMPEGSYPHLRYRNEPLPVGGHLYRPNIRFSITTYKKLRDFVRDLTQYHNPSNTRLNRSRRAILPAYQNLDRSPEGTTSVLNQSNLNPHINVFKTPPYILA